MQNTLWYLSTCTTCKRLLAQLPTQHGLQLQDIKHEPMSAAQLDFLKDIAGSYEALFSKRSRKYREMGLHEKTLTEAEIRSLILSEYTFLKRPVAYIEGEVFAGNAPKTLEALVARVRTLVEMNSYK
ncbi:MAG: ArsC/Spx/MgsR family protein [Chitinophagales bacterium]|nr:arsenate reductase [Bacteroidota bacterium]MCB9042292.1 arsenate reductase [Chitinophagales bacterium]